MGGGGPFEPFVLWREDKEERGVGGAGKSSSKDAEVVGFEEEDAISEPKLVVYDEVEDE